MGPVEFTIKYLRFTESFPYVFFLSMCARVVANSW